MLKAIVLLMIVATAYCDVLGGYYGNQITPAVIKTAEWATNELTTTYEHEGIHHIANIRDYSSQIVSGTNHKFTVDYVVADVDNNYTVSFNKIAFLERFLLRN